MHSVARKHFYISEAQRVYSGRVLWCAATEAPPFLTARSMIMAGYAHRLFVAYPIRGASHESGRALINWQADVSVQDPREVSGQIRGRKTKPASR